MKSLDAIIICGDAPFEVLGKDERDKARLVVDGTPASLPFLREYFRCGRDAGRALAELRRNAVPFLSLNGPYLQQFLETQGYRVELVPLVSLQQDRLAALLRERPRAVAISTTFLPFAAQIDGIAAAVRQLAPDTVIVAGGIQVWKAYLHRRLREAGQIGDDILPAVAKHNYFLDPQRPTPVDLFIVSESGEHTLAAVLGALRDGRDARQLGNVAFHAGNGWQINPVTEEPAAEVAVDWSRVLSAPHNVYVPVQAGLGCGFQCTFCDFTGLRPVRLRPAESLIAEIRTIPALDGVRRVYFTDDNLFPGPKRAKEMLRQLIGARLGLKWRGLIRVSIVDNEVAELMAESGCTEVLLGIESGDAGMLKRMKKLITPEKILRGLETLTRHGISTKSTFIVGFPGETDESIANTVALLNAYPTGGAAIHRYMFFTYAVLPLSEAAQPAFRAEYDLRGYGYHWSHKTMDSARAAAKLESLQECLKPELVPSYVLEVPEIPGFTTSQLKDICHLRNLIVRARRSGASEAGLWQQMEAVFG